MTLFEDLIKEGNEGYPLRDILNNLTVEQIVECANQYAQARFQEVAPSLLVNFWQRSSDACPLECCESERQEDDFRRFVKAIDLTNYKPEYE